MEVDNVITIIISIVGSSTFTLILSTLFFNPIKEKKNYIFNEKKKMYDSIIVFASIAMYPKESKFALRVEHYNIQELNDAENVKNALNDLKMSIPKVKLISKSDKLVKSVENFIDLKNQQSFNFLLKELRKDLYH